MHSLISGSSSQRVESYICRRWKSNLNSQFRTHLQTTRPPAHQSSTSNLNSFEMKHFVAQNCTEVTQYYCTVENTIYGYRPSLGFNAFLVAFFALCAILQLFLGLRAKTWFYALAMVFGCVGETIGYAGRLMMHSNPVSFSQLGSCDSSLTKDSTRTQASRSRSPA